MARQEGQRVTTNVRKNIESVAASKVEKIKKGVGKSGEAVSGTAIEVQKRDVNKKTN